MKPPPESWSVFTWSYQNGCRLMAALTGRSPSTQIQLARACDVEIRPISETAMRNVVAALCSPRCRAIMRRPSVDWDTECPGRAIVCMASMLVADDQAARTDQEAILSQIGRASCRERVV